MPHTDFPKVFVVILNYNGKDTLNKCLSSVFRSNYPNFEVVIVDNASDDGSFEEVRKHIFNAYLIKNPENFGFAKGNNIGIRFALEKFADYVLVLNNDAIIKADTISYLVETMKNNPYCGIASPLIFFPDDSLWFAGGKICWNRMKSIHLFKPLSNKAYHTEYISGCAMFISKDVFKKIGLFDERYFLYYEDADLSLRAKKAGFDLMMDPDSNIVHLEQSNEKNEAKLYWLVLSGLIFFHTHASLLKKAWIMLIYLPLRKLKNAYDIFFKKAPLAKKVRRAYDDFKKIY